MAFKVHVRQQVEATLAARTHAPLMIAPRLVCVGFETGYETLDTLLPGGFPVAGTSEIIGSRCSGRASLAAAYLAEQTRKGHVCAWIDVAGDMMPEAGLADGVDLDRILWIRCSGTSDHPTSQPSARVTNSTPDIHIVPSELKPGSYQKDRSVGTPGAHNRSINTSATRVEQIATDRLPARRGALVLQPRAETRHGSHREDVRKGRPSSFMKLNKPWSRLEQAVKAVDLLVQAGGFGVMVLDLGSIAPQMTHKIPFATWFRWRVALERTRTSLVVLSQAGCAGSSAELVLRVAADLPEPGTVMLASAIDLKWSGEDSRKSP